MSHLSHSHVSQLNYALGLPTASAVIRRSPEDFQVNERLSFALDGQGQHAYLCLQKCNLNTDQVAKLLEKLADVKQVAVGYAGLKDKHAITTQWFSVDLAGKQQPEWAELESDNLKVIEVTRHSRKLKRGAISANSFQIMLCQFEGDKGELNQRLSEVKLSGVPNYFGEQRFGRHDSNLRQAEKLMTGNGKRMKRHLRGIILSAARSYLFNQVLSQRVSDETWRSPILGDVFMLDGSHSIFVAETVDDEIKRRIKEFDIHPTGPMWGQGDLLTKNEVLSIEKEVLSQFPQWCAFLEKAGLKQQRRELRMQVRELKWDWQGDDIILGFQLSAGNYATSVLRELVNYS